jgi:hypothetical protein
MGNEKSILEKITGTMKGIANIAAEAADHAPSADEPPRKTDRPSGGEREENEPESCEDEGQEGAQRKARLVHDVPVLRHPKFQLVHLG